MAIERRKFLKQVLAGSALTIGAAGLRPFELLARNPSGNQLRMLPDLKGSILNVAPTVNQLLPGTKTQVYGVNGSYLGPTVRLNRGESFNVQMQNRLIDEDLIIHWHGLHTSEEMDGHPRYAVGSGEDYNYNFVVNQRAGTYWYHSHTDMLTGPQVYKGIAGMFIVHDEEEQGLGLPSGKYDVPLVLQDKRVTSEFELDYQLSPIDKIHGWQGDTILTNGTPDAQLDVDRTLYRFRLLNGSNARVFLVGFEDERSFHLIATDGGLLEKSVEMSSLYLPPGGRAEILVDFSNDQLDTRLLLQTLQFWGEATPGTRQGKKADLLCCNVVGSSSSGGVIPQTLSTIEKYNPEDAKHTRLFRMHTFEGHHAINSLVFEMNRVDFEVPMGELEIWEFFNPTQFFHPMHIHATQFQTLDRNGSVDNVRPEEQGWKDMVLLFPQERVRVLVRFDKHPGVFMLHCHNLEHEDDGMMMNFRVAPPSSVEADSHNNGGVQVFPNPARTRTRLTFPPKPVERPMKLIDLSGKSILNYVVFPGITSIEIDLRSIPSGTYWCRLENEGVRLNVLP